MAEGAPSPHEDILINVEAFRGAIRKGNWKLVKIALLPGKTELFDLSKDPASRTTSPTVPRDCRRSRSASHGLREREEAERMDQGSPAFLGAQGKTIFDPDFDIDDDGLPHEKPVIPGL